MDLLTKARPCTLLIACLLLQACEFWEPDINDITHLPGTYTLVSLEVDGRNTLPDEPRAVAKLSVVEGVRYQLIIAYVNAPGESVNLYT